MVPKQRLRETGLKDSLWDQEVHLFKLIAKKKRPHCGLLRCSWWSWGESNPRPKAIAGQIYALS